MNWNRIVQSVLPRSRRPVAWRDALSPALFLVLYAATWLWLEWSATATFLRPWWALLMLVTPWLWWMSVSGWGGLGRGRSQAALWIRLTIIGLIAMTLADPRAVRTNKNRAVVFALDRSDSIGDGSVDNARDFILKAVAEKPQQDEAGLVTFGSNAGVELPPRVSFPLEAFNTRIDRDGTNLEQALSLSAAMLPPDKQGRIVLISDGTQTAGSVSSILDDLKSKGISVDVLPIQYQYDKEVYLERLELPQNVKIGENYQAVVILYSLQAGEGKLTLQENNREIHSEDVKYAAGKNRFVIPIYFRNPGYYEYSATIVPKNPDDDQIKFNNNVLSTLFLEGEGRVLVVTDPNGEAHDSENLITALKEEKLVVEEKSSLELSPDVVSYQNYDSIILVNVPADALDLVQQQALKSAVHDLGIGFLMVGGQNSFGPGGYQRTAIEELLPVSMDVTQKKVLPKGCLAIILHTCEFPDGNTWAKRITKQAIQVLSDQDEAGVLNYGIGGEDWIFKPTPVKEINSMIQKINSAEPGDMPSFAGTMQLGLDELVKSDAATKHMIIISDGDPAPPPPAMLKQYIDNSISVSMVAVFPHRPDDVAIMRQVAVATGGRFYFPADAAELPSIFIKESKTIKRSLIHEKKFTPLVEMPSPILKGIDGMLPLYGYVLTSIKPRAEQILVAQGTEQISEGEIDPILAKWRYGLGTTAAFTADLGTKWGKDWLGWDRYRPFLKQLLLDIARVRQQGFLRMNTHLDGGEGVVMVEDFHPEESFLDLQMAVTDARGQAEVIPMKQVAPRRYQAKLPLWGKGRYLISVEGSGGGRNERINGSWIVSYSPEYLRFRSNPKILEEIAERTGGKVLSAEPETSGIFTEDRRERRTTRPIFDWLLTVLVCLIPLDVAVRRIQIDWSLIRTWLLFRRKRGPATETLGSLLERKQAVGEKLESRRGPAPPRDTTGTVFGQTPPATGSKPSPTPPKAAPPQPPPAPPGDSSTTSKLLEMKRRRKQEEEGGGS